MQQSFEETQRLIAYGERKRMEREENAPSREDWERGRQRRPHLTHPRAQLCVVVDLLRSRDPERDTPHNAVVDQRLIRKLWDVRVVRDYKQLEPRGDFSCAVVNNTVLRHWLARQRT